MAFEWTHPKALHRHGETITQGDTFTATEAEQSAFPDRMRRVESDASGDSAAPFDPGEFTIEELRDRIGDLTTSEREALAEAERTGKNRNTAVQILTP